MAACVIAVIDVRDPDRCENEYLPGVLALIGQHDGRSLVVTDTADAKEGSWPAGRMVPVEFPDKAAADAWHAGEACQPLPAVRDSICQGVLAIADGL